MRRVGIFASCIILRDGRLDERQQPSPGAPLDRDQLQGLEAEAQQRGFMRRDSPDAKVYMEMSFRQPERIGGGVPVANLPPVKREKTEFDAYQRSTRDFTSQVTPYGTTGVGLGAGFGAREDKRLGFLRPRKLQPFGGESSIVPKYDENGMPIEAGLTKEQLLKKRLAYMKSFEGTTMSHREHFLLVDLDFERDAMIFGNTREEFEENVTKLKEVISKYTRWERTDNFYYYGIIALKALTAWVLMECVQQHYELKLLAGHYEDFVEAMEETVSGLEENLQRDMRRAREELQSHRPDFRPVVEAVRHEKRRLLDAKATRMAGPDVSTVSNRNGNGKSHLPGEDFPAVGIEEALGAHDAEGKQGRQPPPLAQEQLQTQQRPAVVPLTATSGVKDQHPMDTTHEELYLTTLREQEAQHEMRRLQEAAASSRASYSVFGTLWRNLGGTGVDSVLVTPLQQEDFARLSYAASPTSIETLRAIRRILLPRSEDHIQVVREEMLEYKQQKESKHVHPE
ncbi:hypothetical protein BCY84_10227 [Trypanosoma cruzi cruzi]|nr:hypothetical protein BCY84_10227 [Trypanosoma cruzi cruzi]